MNNILRAAAVLLLTLNSVSAVSGQVTDASIDKLIAISGLGRQLEQLPGTVRAGITQARQKGVNIPDAEFTEMVNIIASSFKPEVITKAIRLELKEKITESDAKSLLAWYQSDLGKKITKAEEAASTPDAYNNMLKNAKTLLANEQQVNIARRIDQAINSVDMAMQVQMNTGIAVYTAMLTAADPAKPANIEPFRTQMEAQMPQIRGRMEQLIILSLVYSYKDLDAKTMNKYIEFLEKPNAQKFNRGVMSGMNTAINQSIDIMAKDLAMVFKAARKKVGKN